MWTLETLCRFSVQKIITIGQYLLKLFENFVGSGFLNHSVDKDRDIVFWLSLRLCWRMCVHVYVQLCMLGWRHSPTGSLSTSSSVSLFIFFASNYICMLSAVYDLCLADVASAVWQYGACAVYSCTHPRQTDVTHWSACRQVAQPVQQVCTNCLPFSSMCNHSSTCFCYMIMYLCRQISLADAYLFLSTNLLYFSAPPTFTCFFLSPIPCN